MFLSEFKSFPNGKHDDIVDAYAYAYNYLSKNPGNQVGTAGKRKRKHDRRHSRWVLLIIFVKICLTVCHGPVM